MYCFINNEKVTDITVVLYMLHVNKPYYLYMYQELSAYGVWT